MGPCLDSTFVRCHPPPPLAGIRAGSERRVSEDNYFRSLTGAQNRCEYNTPTSGGATGSAAVDHAPDLGG